MPDQRAGHFSRHTTDRFTSRAQYYARQRPGYPDEVTPILEKHTGWRPGSVVADIGAGTGISSEFFLRHGNEVHAVEPNPDMRAVASRLAERYPKLRLIDGTAENTGLATASVDFVVAANAFHWFDPGPSRLEFRRILKPAGFAVLLWNERRASSPFRIAFESLIQRFGETCRGIDVVSRQLFDRGSLAVERLYHLRAHDLNGLKELILSASWGPLPGHPEHAPLMAALENLFNEFQVEGQVQVEYETTIAWSRLN